MILSHELNYSEKVNIFSRDTAATYNLFDIFLEYDVIFDERYTAK